MSLSLPIRRLLPSGLLLATGLLLPDAAPAAEAIAGFVDSSGRVVFVNESSPSSLAPSANSAKLTLSTSQGSSARKVIAKVSASPKPSASSADFATSMIGASAPATAPAPSESAETSEPSAATPTEPAEQAEPADLSSREKVHALVDEAAERHQVDAELVHAIVRVESNYNPLAMSNKGARGLMQLIPATARRFGVSNSFDPRDNLDGGIRYLKYLMGMFKGDLRLSLAAYNAGEMAVTRNGGVPPYRETQNYIRKITALYPMRSVAAAIGVPVEPRIVRHVDDRGVIHYSNTDF